MSVQALQVATRSHAGRVRKYNQDSLAFDGSLGVAVLADGMGGHRGGDVASRVAVESALAEMVEAQQESEADDVRCEMSVGHAIETANAALFDMSNVHPELKGMGTTAVAAMFRNRRIYYAHVGDSRLYRVRFGRMRRLTHDHSLVQQMIDDGVFMNRAHAREGGVKDNVLVRSLGTQSAVEVDVGSALAESGDTYLLSTDGLHGLLKDSEIAQMLRDPNGDLEMQADALLDAALAAGGTDNISLVLARPR